MKVVIEGLTEFKRSMETLKRTIRGPGINRARATRYKNDVPGILRGGEARLRPNKSSTVKIQGKAHSPISWTGRIAESMEVKSDKADGSAEAGYFSENRTKPGSRTLSDGRVVNSDLSMTEIAILQSSGFRIPMTGPKGEASRGFLARYGIFPRRTRTYLVVTARPFVDNAGDAFDRRGTDVQVAEGYMDRILGAL